MRTSMHIPKELLDEAIRVSGVSTQTMAVVLGLKELVHKKRIERLLKLKGSGVLDLSQKNLRRMRKR